ncbi:hypothetical protein [Archangium sp.]|uniref:hypothetical protein n=1 Tax=Archangium sp. TaxID=1872627 RepID=UPI002D551119|nr:hypothetical protein [Archangium sp.]HYO57038.1 hypothetical protein [Archangium sp.]
MKNRVVTWVAALGLSMVLSGCKGECAIACEKKQECWRADTDVKACTETCEENSKGNKNFANQADECAECVLKDLVCSELLQRCADDCISVVGL